jgi:hypothetical protein
MEFCNAIKNRQLVGFTYDGHPRIVIPAAYGPHVSTGGLKLRGFQVGGSSVSGALPEWRLFSVEKIIGAHILDETFDEPPPGYSRNDDHLNVICQL